jgi:cytochrome P450
MADERTTHRDLLEQELAEAQGTDIEELHALYGEQRRTCPFQKVEGAEAVQYLGRQRGPYGGSAGEMYIAWKHEDVAQVMRDATHFYKPGPGGPFSNTLLSMNGEEHRKFRELVKEPFSPAAIAEWERTLIDPLMHRLIDRFEPAGRADLVRDYTSQFPFHVIRELLGFPESDHDEFIGLAFPHAEPGSVGFDEAWERQIDEFIFPRIHAARAGTRGNNLLSVLVEAEIDGRQLTDLELSRFLVLLIPAGADTTYAASGNLLFGLLSNGGEQLGLLREHPNRLARAVDEAVRWQNSAATSFMRIAQLDTEVHGVEIPVGTVIAAHVSSHNRDEDRYDHPDEFDIMRADPAHGIFGYGPHACIGMHLARAEMRSAVKALMARLPEVRLDPEQPAPYVRAGHGFPSPPALPVVF